MLFSIKKYKALGFFNKSFGYKSNLYAGIPSTNLYLYFDSYRDFKLL